MRADSLTAWRVPSGAMCKLNLLLCAMGNGCLVGLHDALANDTHDQSMIVPRKESMNLGVNCESVRNGHGMAGAYIWLTRINRPGCARSHSHTQLLRVRTIRGI